MDTASQRILAQLQKVTEERLRRQQEPMLLERVKRLKAYQQARFRRTYADLLTSPRYGQAALFFLNELYGPEDFTQRDEQFARIVAPLVRLFPEEIVVTVEDLATLHALSESLDGEMARHLPQPTVDPTAYVNAWQLTGQTEARAEQIRLLLQIGASLDRLTRSSLLHRALRAMRGPARASGLGDLQQLLEGGFNAFRAMQGADEFLATVQDREERLSRCLFAADAVAQATRRQGAVPDSRDPLSQLP